jgi:hypothetical protein
LTGAKFSTTSEVNVSHFGMAEAMGLKARSRCYLQGHDVITEFHEKQLISSKVIKGDRDGQTEM